MKHLGSHDVAKHERWGTTMERIEEIGAIDGNELGPWGLQVGLQTILALKERWARHDHLQRDSTTPMSTRMGEEREGDRGKVAEASDLAEE
jgi:hypothetical protein